MGTGLVVKIAIPCQSCDSTGRGKAAIEDHFDLSFELDHHLREKGKTQLADEMHQLIERWKIAASGSTRHWASVTLCCKRSHLWVPIATFRRADSENLGGAGLKRSRTEAASATCSLKILCDTS